MDTASKNKDEKDIRDLIARHFEGMKWDSNTEADWEKFKADFHPEAVLFPAARPVQPKSLDGFIERMNRVANESLHTFEEATLGMQILNFGNVAVVMAASELVENDSEVNHDVSGYLLIKNDDRWVIAAHAWDHASEALPVPEELCGT